MWLFEKHYSLKDSGLFRGFTDWHCHILPGVDDGVQVMDESLAILCLYEQLGVKTVWFTPHIMEDVPNTPVGLRERFQSLCRNYTGSIALHLAAEHMLDNLFEERLAADELLPIGDGGNHLLVETSCYNPPMNLYSLLEEILAKGYFPVLAHPERYAYMSESDYRNLKEMRIRFQLNLPSLAGMYGEGVRKKALWLLRNDMYDLYGTDIHNLRVFTSILTRKSLDSKICKKLREIDPGFLGE